MNLPLDSIELFKLCADDLDNSNAWSEFLRRYAMKIKYFIRGAVRQTRAGTHRPIDVATYQESDLFQNALVRLVEHDCTAMKRFSGTSESALSAYLAVICRSVVFDTMRHSAANKRRRPVDAEYDESIMNHESLRLIADTGCDRQILIRELKSFAIRTAQSHSGDASLRDQLVFQLHFFDGLSHSQIAQCKGVNLTKAGVEKVIKRLVERVQFLASSGRSGEALQ
jgi:RNA polymerase sigma factor (sigma-70 family)